MTKTKKTKEKSVEEGGRGHWHDGELFARDYPELIGKRAKFKNNPGYIRDTLGRTGVIVTCEHNQDIPTLYLKFDEPIRNGYEDSMITETLIIKQNTIELLEEL